MRRYLLYGMGAALLAAAMTEVARQEFAGRMDEIRIFFRLFVLDERIAIAGIACLVIGAALSERIGRGADHIAEVLTRAPLRTAFVAAAVLAAGAHFVMLTHPLSADEAAAVFQARAFAAGRTAGRLPPELLDRLFGAGFIGFFYEANRETGAVISTYWPGFALLLTPFASVGLEWLLNPILGACTLIVLHRLAASAFPGTHAPGYAVLFALASPAFTFNSMSLFAMPAHLLANAIYALLLLRPSAARLFVAGSVGGFALMLHHPYPHILFAIPWFAWVLSRPERWRNLTVLAAGYAAVLLPLVAFWVAAHAAVAGAPATPETVAAGRGALGEALGAARYALTIPNPNSATARSMDLAKLVIWAAPGLVVLAVAGVHRHRAVSAVALLGASALFMLLGYLFVNFDQGAGWGARYLHPAWIVLPVAAAGALVARRQAAGTEALRRVVLPVAVVSALLLNGAVAWTVGTFVRDHVRQVPEPLPLVRQVIVLNNGAGYYMHNLVQNDPFLRNRVIVLDGAEGAGRGLVQRHFPGARLARSERTGDVWIIE